MTTEARRKYGEQLRLRKAGVASALEHTVPLSEAKPHLYADARMLIDNVRDVYQKQRVQASPYGLYDVAGNVFTGFEEGENKQWLLLERLLSTTARKAFEATVVPATGCPYHESLKNLGHISLNPSTVGTPDAERLREIVFPGAQFAPVTIVNLLKRMPAMAAIHGASASTETLARDSARSLLQEPLHHPQQYAKAFNFCLADGVHGSDFILDRNSFMPSDVIEAYTTLGLDAAGREIIKWSVPTTDFVLRVTVSVANRLEGSERAAVGDHITTYPTGTRLGDIQIDEPTIGCPGNQFAYDMWDQAVDVIVGEGLWETSAAQ